MQRKKLILEPHPAGFFSNFNKIIQAFVHYNDSIEEIVWKMSGNGMDHYNCGEVFSQLFEPHKPSLLSKNLEEVTISRYIDVSITAHHVADIYKQSNQQWRYTYNQAYKTYIKHAAIVNNTWNEIYEPQFVEYKNKTKVGVLIRNNNLSTEQPRRMLPNRDAYIQILNSLNIENFVIVCAIDNKQDLSFFQELYSNCIFNKNTTRTNTPYEPEPHLHGLLSLQDAIYHYLEGVALSKCDYLIHPVSNISTASMYMNPDIKNIFLIG